jgi:hypothetical protein
LCVCVCPARSALSFPTPMPKRGCHAAPDPLVLLALPAVLPDAG